MCKPESASIARVSWQQRKEQIQLRSALKREGLGRDQSFSKLAAPVTREQPRDQHSYVKRLILLANDACMRCSVLLNYFTSMLVPTLREANDLLLCTAQSHHKHARTDPARG
eukprot:1152091-Pelagomonas_calceolata.AAC.8